MTDSKHIASMIFWVVLVGIFGLLPVVKMSEYHLLLANHILIWGMFATAFNMLWGVTGMLSFGQALYYGLGAYGIGLFVHHLGDSWYFTGFAVGLVASIVVSALIGLLIIRVSGVFFTVLTLAFGQLAWRLTFTLYHFTGGDDGIQGFAPPGILDNKVVYYYFTLVLVMLSIWILRRLAGSPMGLLLRCVRQNPERVRFLGRSVRYSQLRIYVISSFFAALAGALMAGADKSIHTDMLYWTTSGEVILMSVLGGIGQFFGPLIGAAVIILIEDVVGASTEFWPLIIGTVMITMVVLFPLGLVGELSRVKSWLSARKAKEGV